MPQYEPPKASLERLGQVTALIADPRTREIPTGSYKGAHRIFRLPGGEIVSDSGLAADADGSRYYPQDRDGKYGTALTLDRKRNSILDAASIPYIAFCSVFAKHNGFSKGDYAVIIYKDRLCYAFYGDVSGHATFEHGGLDLHQWSFGEASICVHLALGHSVLSHNRPHGAPRGSQAVNGLWFTNTGIPSDVITIVFPHSGDGTGHNAATVEAHARPLWEALRGGGIAKS